MREQGDPVRLERGQVPLVDRCELLQCRGGIGLGEGHEQRGIGSEAPAPVDHLGQLGHSRIAGAVHRLVALPRDLLAQGGALQGRGEGAQVEFDEPRLQRRHLAQSRHRLAVAPGSLLRRTSGRLVTVPGILGRDRRTRRQPSDIPVEGAGERLVEVVDVEDERALRRGEHPEVGGMRITAQLHGQPTRGQEAEVRGHDRRGTPEEGELVARHALVAQRDERGFTVGVLSMQDGQRVASPIDRRDLGERLQRDLAPPIAPLLMPLLPAGAPVAEPGGLPT